MLQPYLFDTSFQWPETTANGTTTSKYHLSFLCLCGHSYILHFISKSVCCQYFKSLTEAFFFPLFFFSSFCSKLSFASSSIVTVWSGLRMRERRQTVGEIDCTADRIAQPDCSSAVTWHETAAEPPLIS